MCVGYLSLERSVLLCYVVRVRSEEVGESPVVERESIRVFNAHEFAPPSLHAPLIPPATEQLSLVTYIHIN